MTVNADVVLHPEMSILENKSAGFSLR